MRDDQVEESLAVLARPIQRHIRPPLPKVAAPCQFKNNHSTEMCSGSEAGSCLRLIDSCITHLKAQGPARTCNESKEEEEKWTARKSGRAVLSGAPAAVWECTLRVDEFRAPVLRASKCSQIF